eukprot:1507794-Lingulodinium_polyedra.AAC.1
MEYAIARNIVHLHLDAAPAGLELSEVTQAQHTMSQVDRFVFPDAHGVILLASGKRRHQGCAIGRPPF